MTYLGDFKIRIEKNDYPGFLKLWEEYCYSDEFDTEELITILTLSMHAPLAASFGTHVEKGLLLWEKIPQKKESQKVLKLIFQIQNTHSEKLYEIGMRFLEEMYPNDPLFQEKIRMIHLRPGEQFKGAIGNYELLTHMKKGNFVFHSGGWGASEILEVSMIREELSLECEHVVGVKHLSFVNAFKTLIPIEQDHFLARRFGDPDLLEKQARENPVEVLRTLLKDLGPKTAAEIKEELIDLVIPESSWNRWWQNARNKLKKDTKVSCPQALREPFSLLEEEVPHEVAFYKALEEKPSVEETIQMVYSFLRDFSETLKNKDFKASLEKRIQELLEAKELNEGQRLSLLFFLDDLKALKKTSEIKELIESIEDPLDFLQKIDVISLKKRTLTLIRSIRSDWEKIFMDLLFAIEQNLLRDYLIQELKNAAGLLEKIQELVSHPLSYPDVFVWYFQKILDGKKLPFSDKEGLPLFFEGFLILLDHTEKRQELKDLSKKMLSLLLHNRYKMVRDMMQLASIEQAEEFILLATKCAALTDHDRKIIHSLAEVAFPALAKGKKSEEEEEIIWTTQTGYQKIKERIEKIATVETVENAKEIEEARSHGDLRENSEFKFALEKRERLQAELKALSDQLQFSRIITKADVPEGRVGVGSIVVCKNGEGAVQEFTILGPWDANPEERILSFQSKFAKAMQGLAINESFSFQGEKFTIVEIRNYLESK